MRVLGSRQQTTHESLTMPALPSQSAESNDDTRPRSAPPFSRANETEKDISHDGASPLGPVEQVQAFDRGHFIFSSDTADPEGTRALDRAVNVCESAHHPVPSRPAECERGLRALDGQPWGV